MRAPKICLSLQLLGMRAHIRNNPSLHIHPWRVEAIKVAEVTGSSAESTPKMNTSSIEAEAVGCPVCSLSHRFF